MGDTNLIAIKIGNARREVRAPQTWNDLDLRTLLLFYQTLFTRQGSEFTAAGFTNVKLITMTQQVLRVDSAFMAQWEADCLRQDEQFGGQFFCHELQQVLHATLGGLFDVGADEAAGITTYEPKLNLTKNPYPSLAHTAKSKNGRKKTAWYYAPDDGLDNLTLYELAYTFTLFENYLKTNDDAMANRLIATLYRPSRPETQAERESAWFGDRRQPLRRYEKKIEERAAMVATLPMLTRRLIVFWFSSCRQAIVARYGKVFRRDSGDTRAVGYGWGGVLLAMAGGPVGLDAIADQHYSNGLTWLSMKEDERRETDAQMSKLRKK